MMRFHTASKYLSADDIRKPVTVTITAVKMEPVGRPGEEPVEKFVLHFKELDKGLILNTTNGKTLCKAYDTDLCDEWLGRQLQIFVREVDFQGETVPGLRVRPVLHEKRGKKR